MIPHVKAVIDSAKANKLTAAGFIQRSANAVAVGNKAGLFGYHTYHGFEPDQHHAERGRRKLGMGLADFGIAQRRQWRNSGTHFDREVRARRGAREESSIPESTR